MRALTLIFVSVFALVSCWNENVQEYADVYNHDSMVNASREADRLDSIANVKTQFGIVHQIVKPLSIPSWIHVDSMNQYAKLHIMTSVQDVLFPVEFEILAGSTVEPFARQDGNSFFGIWYQIRSQEPMQDGLETKDIWLVLYGSDSLPSTAHCFATSGIGSGYSYVYSSGVFKEVFVEQMEELNVTIKEIQIGNGEFFASHDESKSFGSGSDADQKSKKYIADFFD